MVEVTEELLVQQVSFINISSKFNIVTGECPVADPGGVRGVQMHPPFQGLPSRVTLVHVVSLVPVVPLVPLVSVVPLVSMVPVVPVVPVMPVVPVVPLVSVHGVSGV